MDIDFNNVLKRYQERITALLHANVLLECQVEQLQAENEQLKTPPSHTNGAVDVEPEVVAAMVQEN